MNADAIYQAVRHFTYFHPLTTLWILVAVLCSEVVIIVCAELRKGGR